MESTNKLKDVNGNESDIVKITWGKKSIERLHIDFCKASIIPLEDITSEKLYDYENPISKEEILEEWKFVKEIYKSEWKCTCGKLAYNHNIRRLEAGVDLECPYCHKIIHTMDNRNWG